MSSSIFYGALFFMECKVVVFWYWYNGDCFVVGEDNRLDQVELENVCEDIS